MPGVFALAPRHSDSAAVACRNAIFRTRLDALCATPALVADQLFPLCTLRPLQYFVVDTKQGDTICTGKDGLGCGMVVQDHKVCTCTYSIIDS
jgi:hypothetical protein